MDDAAFVDPDWNAPLDLAERLVALPSEGLVKGMFLQTIVEDARLASGRAPGRGRYTAFKDYPLREWIELLPECAALAHPKLPVREAMRRLAAKGYPTFAESMVGRVLMSVAGRNFGAALRLVPKIYSVSGNVASAEVDIPEDGRALVRLRGVWDFPDSWQVGVFEGGLRAFGKVGTVRIRVHGLAEADLAIAWRV